MRAFAKALCLGCIVTALLPVAALAASFVPALPTVTPLPSSAQSHPWLYYKLTLKPLDLDKAGYVEEEYLVSGTANVYDWDANPAKDLDVKYKAVPYTTRILVRRPADPAKFSGTVAVETLNGERAFDMAMMFAWMGREMLARGDVWVGISGPSVFDTFKHYDSARYAALSFANPVPPDQRACPGATGTRGNATESGLRLDGYAQLGRWLRSKAPAGNPLASWAIKDVFLIGHTANDVATYASSVAHQARLENGKPVYDGYLMHSGSDAGPLMNCGLVLPPGDPRSTPGHLGVPVVIIKTQGDVPYAARPDSDDPADPSRVYEISGAPHVDTYLYGWLPTVAEQRKAIDLTKASPVTDEWATDQTCDTPDLKMTDYPQGFIMAGAFANMDRYVRDHTPMPKAEPIAMDGTKIRLDQYGNAVGGVRTPYLDVPTGTYAMPLTGQPICANMGEHQVWDWGRTLAIYGSYDAYRQKAEAAMARLVAGRWVSPEDADRIRKDVLP